MRLFRLLMAFVAMGCIVNNAQALPLNASVPIDRTGDPISGMQGRRSNLHTLAQPGMLGQSAAGLLAPVDFSLSSSTANTVQFTTQWTAKVFGLGVGATGLMHIDINNDGIEEMVFASNLYKAVDAWSVLSYQKTDKTWVISRQVLIPQGRSVTALYTYRDKANKAMMAYGTLDGANLATVRIVNLADGALVKEIVVNKWGNAVNEIMVGDADNDGGAELIVVTDRSSYFYNLGRYSASGRIAYGGVHAALGNVDNDAEIELIYNGGKVVSYKDAEATLEWDYSLGFGNWVRTVNIDGDAADEIIGAERSSYYVRAFDADNKSVKWESRTLDINALRIADINNDGVDDIVYSDGQWGRLHALDQNGAEFWWLANPGWGSSDLAIFDADADGDQDIAWNADVLYVYDILQKNKLFQSAMLYPPFRAVTFGDVDGDGYNDFITASFSSSANITGINSYNNGVIQVLDADTGAQKWQSKSGFLPYGIEKGISSVAVGDVDNDNDRLKELVVASGKIYNGTIYIVDAKNHILKKTIDMKTEAMMVAVKIADIDGDGRNDIIAGGGRGYSYAPVYVYVVDGLTGAIKWHSQNLTDKWKGVYGLAVADIDGNGNQDIVVSLDRLFVFDGVTHVNTVSTADNYTGVTTMPVKGKSSHLIVAGTQSGLLQVFGNDLSAPKASYAVCATAIGAVERLTNTQILFVCGDYLKLFDLPSKTVTWTSGNPIAQGSETDALAVTAINKQMKVGVGGSLSRLLRYVPAP